MSGPHTTAVRLHTALLARGETVAVAESLTAGLLGATMTEAAGSSATFRGGLVVYATDLKASLAGVPVALLAQHGPVSRPVAAALAAGVAQRLGADWGVATTGVAGPAAQGAAPVGLVFVAVARRDRAELQDRGATVREVRLAGDRAAIRHQSVAAAVDLLLDTLNTAPPAESR